MRLAKLDIHGYRKLVDTECRFSGKLTAIVGPNEAGKSSLLEALVSVQNSEEIPFSAHPYGRNVQPETAALVAWYRLAPDDIQALGDLDTDDVPTYYVVEKKYDGSRIHRTEPDIKRRTTPRQTAISAVGRYATTAAAKALVRGVEGGEAGDALDDVSKLLAERELDSPLADDEWGTVDFLISELADEGTSARGRQAREALVGWREHMRQNSPSTIALEILDKREPVFAIFDDDERNLRSTYTLQDVAQDPPAALRNMAALADLDLLALRDSFEVNDPGAVTTATENADEKLQGRLNDAWKQSNIVVRMPLDGGIIQVLVRTDAPRYSLVAEHSDGLRTFVALTAFAHSLKRADVPLVLLIDEAEQHLHYDAQADLVRMLERQSVASQVIYTTHSAGCLPSDLGTGVRGVAPVEGEGRSNVTNSLWHLGPGFSPLLMALGAGAAAFAPSRFAVLGEGATEMLVLPSMIREAVGVERLDFQIAAGLAEVGNSDLQDLELEAPRVAYVVDGDEGGDEHAARLRNSGVDLSRIAQLGGEGSGHCIENLLKEDVHLEAINEVLAQLGNTERMTKEDLKAAPTREDSIKAWCQAVGSPVPGKPAVAVALVELADEKKLLTREGVKILRDLHADVVKALGIPESP